MQPFLDITIQFCYFLGISLYWGSTLLKDHAGSTRQISYLQKMFVSSGIHFVVVRRITFTKKIRH